MGYEPSTEQPAPATDSPAAPARANPVARDIVIKEYAVRAQAGAGAAMPALNGDGAHFVVGQWMMPRDMLSARRIPPDHLAVIEVEGDSMEPDYLAGDRVLVDRSARVPSPPGIYVLWDGFGLVLKRAEIVLGSAPPRVRLSSINPAYTAYECPLADVHINGRVVGKWMWK